MTHKNKINYLILLFVSFSLSLFSQESPKIKLGGALRFNYNYSNWQDEGNDLGGEFVYDVFRLNANGSYKNLILDAEYRFYASSSGGAMLKHGWVGYNFNSEHQLQVGLNIVPFGIMPYNSNNWFFNINYYIGLEDDADMGVKYIYTTSEWDVAVAFYKNSDIINPHGEISSSRYSYDIAGKNKEVNQGNIRISRKFGNEMFNHELGLSGQIGGIYNINTREIGSRSAFAAHYVLNAGKFNLKAQYTTYNISPKNEEGANINFVEMGAYGANYNVATKADTYTLGLAYNIPVNKGILDNIIVYNDFGLMKKRADNTNNSHQNVTGMMFTMGPIYTYLDYALGKNHAWLGGSWMDSFANGLEDEDWHARLNLNIGYYF